MSQKFPIVLKKVFFTECFFYKQEELKRFMYNGGEGKWVPIQEIVEMRTGRPGPKKSNSDPLSDVRDMEAMTSDNNAKTGTVILNSEPLDCQYKVLSKLPFAFILCEKDVLFKLPVSICMINHETINLIIMKVQTTSVAELIARDFAQDGW